MKKLIAILLASVMVACCFAVSASAADTNLVAGKTYALTSNDETIAYNGVCEDGVNLPEGALGLYSGSALLTDGSYRVGTEDAMLKDAVSGKTVEFAGTTRAYTLTFDLGGTFAVSSVVIRNGKIAGNRSINVTGIQVSADGTNWTPVDFTNSFAVVANAEQVNAAFAAGGSDPRDAYFDITSTFTADAAHIAVTFDTSNPGADYGHNFYVENSGSDLRGYIASFDEIEIYGSEASTPTPAPIESEDAPIESEDAPVASEDAPVESEDAPVESEDAPVASEDAPVESEDAPVASEDAPVESEDAPVASEDAPVESTPVESTPVESTPVESTPESTPVESTPVESTPVEDNDTPDTSDAGLAVFAVLAVVSLAGVVVAKKVK